MVVDLIFLIIIIFLSIVGSLLQLIDFLIPEEIADSMALLLSYFNYFEGIFPIFELLNVLSFLVGFFAIWYTVKIIFKLWALIPFIGKHIKINK